MVVIVDYGMGNVGSILNMLKKVGALAKISGDPVDIMKADRLILPGVGTFDEGMKNLADRRIIDVLNKRVLEDKCNILGICLGMQLLTKRSEEGHLAGLGWIQAETIRFKAENTNIKIPHMGWNEVKPVNKTSLFLGYNNIPRYYFVHSYHVACKNPEDILGTSFHGYEFTAAVKKANIMGTQFHPEKSHKYGMQLLQNFMNL